MADTILSLHAHPDDEVMLTGELLAKANANGIRTIVVYGTRGDAGETGLELGEQPLGERREAEAREACAEIGVDRIEFLGHLDSGMAGTEANHDPGAFCNADPERVVDQLVELMADEDLLAVVGYDANGTYRHPDHLQVHRVAHAFAARIDVPWLLDATYNREYMAALPDSDGVIDPDYASAETDLTHFVQGEEWFRAKMEGVKRHVSQARPRKRSAGSRDDSGEQPQPQQKRGIDHWRARNGTEWFIARSPTGATDLGPLAAVLEPKHTWPGPLTR